MKLATLLYIKNSNGEYLLIERLKEPNKGLLSPPGGKIEIDKAESPVNCAVREAFEECGLETRPDDWKLLGIVTEKDYPKIGNIIIFIFEYKKSEDELPAICNEGAFRFVHPEKLNEYNLPETDKLFIWDFVLKNRKNEVFFLDLDCSKNPIECIK